MKRSTKSKSQAYLLPIKSAKSSQLSMKKQKASVLEKNRQRIDELRKSQMVMQEEVNLLKKHCF